MNRGRQALQFCLDSAVVVVIQIFNEFLFEMFHGLIFLQIQQLTFEQPEEILYHRIVQTVPLAAHALPDAFLAEHPLILLMLVLPALIGFVPSGIFAKALSSMVVTMLSTGRSDMV